jgi:hypothetical protein
LYYPGITNIPGKPNAEEKTRSIIDRFKKAGSPEPSIKFRVPLIPSQAKAKLNIESEAPSPR